MTPGRRDFLASISFGAALLASGCTGNSEGSAGTVSHSSTATPPEQTETETTPTATESSLLSDAEEKVERAEDLYISWDGLEAHSVLSVTVTSLPRRFEEINTLLDDARQLYRQYHDDHPGRGGVQIQLNWVRTLRDWVHIQYETIHAFWALRAIRHRVFVQDFTKLEKDVEEFEDRISAASKRLEDHKRWWEEDRSGHLADVSASAYDAKVLQLELAIHSMPFVKESLVDYAPVSRALVDLLSKYVDDPASVEQNAFEDLLSDLSGIETDLREFCCATDDVGDFIETYREAITAASDGMEQLKKAASAARDGDADSRRQYEKQAKDAFGKSDLLIHEDGEVAGLVERLGG